MASLSSGQERRKGWQFVRVRVRRTLTRATVALALLAPVVPVTTSPAQAAAQVKGIDVSKYQHDTGKPIDWAKVIASGRTFAIIKATGGSNRIDPWFEREWAAAGKAGIIRGAYHYADPSGSAEQQARLIVKVVGSTREAGNLGIALDLEDNAGLSPAALARWAHRFLDEVERLTGRTPLLYTYVNFWQTRMANNKTFGAYPLWLARYGPKPAPLAGWSQWTIWQNSSTTRIPGIPGYTDSNILCCSAGTLTALADGRSRAIAALWRDLGGASGKLGLPLGPEERIPGGWGQTFQKGYVASTATHGTHAVLGDVWKRYKANGAAKGALGVPTGTATAPLAGIVQQEFVNGRIVSSAATGAHAVSGDILGRWLKDGGLRSQEGLPTSELVDGRQQVVGGGLYRTDDGVRLVPGAIRDRYEELGGPDSYLGLPTAEAQVLSEDARLVRFQLGQLMELVLAGQRVVV
jgi:lysozyme